MPSPPRSSSIAWASCLEVRPGSPCFTPRCDAAILQHLGHALEQDRLSELVARHGKDLSDLRTKHAADNEAFDKAVVQANELMAALSGFKLDSDEVERQQKLTEQANNRSEQAGLIQAQQRVCEAQIRGECGQTFAYRDHEIKSDWYDDAMPDINAARFGRQHLQQVLAE